MIVLPMKINRRVVISLFLMIVTFNIYSQDMKKYVCNGWGIDVFEDADINSKVVGHVPFGEPVEIIENTDIEVQNEGKGFWWKKIVYKNVSGFVSSKYLVNLFKTAIKVKRMEGKWVRIEWNSKQFHPEREYLSFVYSGKDEEASFIVNNKAKFVADTDTDFWIFDGDVGFYSHQEHYVYENEKIYCHISHYKGTIEYDEDGNPSDEPVTIEQYEYDFVYEKLNFYKEPESYRSVDGNRLYRTISFESLVLWTNPSFSSRTAAIIGPCTAIEVLDVKKDSGETVPGWVKVSVLKPLKAGGYEKTGIVGWCYWGQ
ncbi:SH3 domain-containing protein [Treponema sp.]|uniref:SH3 domain-containing protein n=1 Tax=Treponema sp. TaxID=166 RepID=UPI003890F9AF